MIFLSHNSKDKIIVEPIAIRLRGIFGQENVFYDSWSIQPGDGIIDRMNEGLANCTIFYFFVSNNSLSSYMVKLEWQNAVMKASNGKAKLIPVRIDNCQIPPILSQSLYIDLYTNGFDVALRQIVDIATGSNTYRPQFTSVSNLEARTTSFVGRDIEVEVSANYYMEPIPHFLFATPNAENEISFECIGCNMYTSSFNKGLLVKDNGKAHENAIFLAPPDLITPGFPFIAHFKALTENDIRISSVWHEEAKNNWKSIPFLIKR
ncbi:TIR domain-containing protein [Prevotella sp. khp7]|uniref:toll/interleukin-1 receptor domain-containing protein n=1 Tax=Prevotella sp. khp7 TaxID=1761885 RepID=UPI0008D7D4B6|nr:toll/interleukin-1 receptor domain-containing protein [Prevotella sp. khp7]SEW23485.1 TIR domain-containing protein [Prevotella sp. khp7]